MKIIILFLCFIFASDLYSQNYHFNQHEVSTDLLRMNPSSIFRYKNELLFIGTKEGLIAFDGKKHDVMVREDGGNQEPSSYFHDGEYLWIGYSDGGIFRLVDFKLKPWEIAEGWPKSKITGIGKDNIGQMWFSTYGEGLYVYAKEVLYNFNTDDGLEGNDIYNLVVDNAGKIFAGTDHGLIVCRFENEKKIIEKSTFLSAMPNEIITSLHLDQLDNKLYIGTFENGLWMYDFETKKVLQILKTNNQIKKIGIAGFGILALADHKNNPLMYYDYLNYKSKTFHPKGTESPLSILDILCDAEGNIWILCNNNGLISSPGIFSVRETNIINIQALLEVDGNVYIGNDEGLFCNHQGADALPILKKENILSLYYHKSKNEIWAGTFGDGIKIIDQKGKLIKALNEKNGLSNNNVFCITQREGFIWVSTLAGLNKLSPDGTVLKQLNKKSGLPTDYNYTLFTDKSNNLWVGTDGKGITVIDKNDHIKQITNDQTIISFAEDKNKKIWFSTLNNGLGKIEKDSIRWFGLSEGLTELHISGITSDKDGNIISFHHTGMDIIDPDTHTIICIGNNTGIRKWEQNINPFFNDFMHPILISEGSRIITYQPVHQPFLKAQLIIKTALAGKILLKQAEYNILSYKDNDFLIEYAGIWFSDPDVVQYRYKMDGIDTEWRYTKDQKLIYPNLGSGNYTFIIECAANKTFSGAVTYEIKFRIKPAIWETWWFFFGLVVIFISIVYVWNESRNRRRKQLEEIKMDQVRSQLETLKSQINPHFLFNSFNTLVSIIESKPEQAVTFVEKLSDFYRNMLQFRDKDLIPLKDELEINQNYSFLLDQRFGNTVQIRTNIVNNDWLIIPLTLQILTENAVKHNAASKASPLIISITCENDTLKVSNNIQTRRTTEKSTHFGLQSLAKRYLNITGKEIIVLVTQQQFCITIPLIKNKS